MTIEIRINFSPEENQVSGAENVWNQWSEDGVDNLLTIEGAVSPIGFEFPDGSPFIAITESNGRDATGDAEWTNDGGAKNNVVRTNQELPSSRIMRLTGLSEGTEYSIEFAPMRSSGVGNERIFTASLDNHNDDYPSLDSNGNMSETLVLSFVATDSTQDIWIAQESESTSAFLAAARIMWEVPKPQVDLSFENIRPNDSISGVYSNFRFSDPSGTVTLTDTDGNTFTVQHSVDTVNRIFTGPFFVLPTVGDPAVQGVKEGTITLELK